MGAAPVSLSEWHTPAAVISTYLKQGITIFLSSTLLYHPMYMCVVCRDSRPGPLGACVRFVAVSTRQSLVCFLFHGINSMVSIANLARHQASFVTADSFTSFGFTKLC